MLLLLLPRKRRSERSDDLRSELFRAATRPSNMLATIERYLADLAVKSRQPNMTESRTLERTSQ